MSVLPVSLVCFDLGGVVLRICRSWDEGLAAAGLEPRAGELHAARRAELEALLQDYHRGRATLDQFATGYSGLVDGAYTAGEIRRVHDAWLLGEYPGIGALVRELHDLGLATAALSNTNHEHWIRMDEFPAVMSIQHRYASHLENAHKPDESFYRALERGVGVEGEAIVFFDDLPENVEGARAVGWRAHRVDPHAPTAPQIRSLLRDEGVPVAGA